MLEQHSDLSQRLHRTWVQALFKLGFSELAAIAIDVSISIDSRIIEESYGYDSYELHRPEKIVLSVPLYTLSRFEENFEKLRDILILVGKGNIYEYCTNGNKGNVIRIEDIEFSFCVALLEVEEDWKNVVRRMIVDAQDPNQGVITERAFAKKGQDSYIYNEMKFASKTEIRVAQELEGRKILFFPLPLAVRAETGNFYKDHREVDFLICHDGVWGILEVAHHPDRYEKDKEKDAWFKKSGILCIEHYTAEKCFNFPKQVVDEFLTILARYKR